MLVCPKCNKNYKKSLLKKSVCEVCNIKLESVYTMEDVKINVLDMPYGNPERWVTSTLAESYKLEELVEITKHGIKSVYHRERNWLHDVMDDNGIPYRIDFTITKMGKKHIETARIYVLPEHADAVYGFIKEYNSQAGGAGRFNIR